GLRVASRAPELREPRGPQQYIQRAWWRGAEGVRTTEKKRKPLVKTATTDSLFFDVSVRKVGLQPKRRRINCPLLLFSPRVIGPYRVNVNEKAQKSK
ncbi:MAG: hypothetical protein PV344_06945, partial [Anaplasma sp.]|nr:hypothetical protein [Anaplasma sp.]